MIALRLRLLAVLLAGSLLLHEAVFGVGGGGEGPAHGYLAQLLPFGAALAASAVLAALLAPLLGRRPDAAPAPIAPLALAAALAGIFTAQELVEAALLGGGAEALAGSAAAAWSLFPLAILFGGLSAALVAWMQRTSVLILSLVERRSIRRGRRRERSAPWPRCFRRPGPRLSPLAFGLACRPPPVQLGTPSN